MKRLLVLLSLLFASTVAIAADNPISCSGASCKVTVSARDVSAVSTISAAFDNLALRFQGNGSTSENAERGLWWKDSVDRWGITFNTSDSSDPLKFKYQSIVAGQVDSSGAWTFGGTTAGDGGTHLFQSNGNTNLKVTSNGTSKDASMTVNSSTNNVSTVASYRFETAGSKRWEIRTGQGFTNGGSIPADAVEFVNATGTTQGIISQAGAWTLGPAAGNQAHTFNGWIAVNGTTVNATAVQISGRRVNTVNSTNQTLGTAANMQGELLVINTSTGENCKFFLRTTAAVQEISDPSNVCGLTDGGAFAVNVFVSGANIQVDGNSTVNTLMEFHGVGAL